jgi:hypothetical protein
VRAALLILTLVSLAHYAGSSSLALTVTCLVLAGAWVVGRVMGLGGRR